MRFDWFLLSIVAFLSLSGCDKSGIHALGRVRDNLGPCTSETATWLRSTETGTEIFLIGEPSVAADGSPASGCFARGFVEHDSTTHLEFGTYADDGTGTAGTFSYTSVYDFLYEPEESLIDRHGSGREDQSPPSAVPIAMSIDGVDLLLTYAGETRRLTSMLDVIDALEPSAQEGAEDLFRLFNLPLFTSQARILGFGSTSMTQYLNETVGFAGTIENLVTVGLTNLLHPKTDIEYVELMDLTGITHDGLIRSWVDFSGTGTMSGVVTFRMDGRTKRVRGAVDYENLLVRKGVAGGGEYSLHVEGGGDFVISYTLAADIDLRTLLPVRAP